MSFLVGRVMGGRLVAQGYIPPTTTRISIDLMPADDVGIAQMTVTFGVTDEMFKTMLDDEGEQPPAGSAALRREPTECERVTAAQLARARARLKFPFGQRPRGIRTTWASRKGD